MKTMVIGGLMATLLTFQAVAQRAENDDMYFNSKDRKKLNEFAVSSDRLSSKDRIDSDYEAFKKKHFEDDQNNTNNQEEISNPTDSYSSRNINPEYIARSNSEQASENDQDYFDKDYESNVTDSYSSGNVYNSNNYNSRNNWNNWSGGSRWNSCYSCYGYNDPWMNPYYGRGSGLTISLMYGNAWSYGPNYGWGNNYYYDPFGYSPYGNYSPYAYSYYGNGYGYGGYPNYYYGNSDYSRPNYGKRPSRHSSMVTPTRLRTPSSNPANSVNSTNGRIRRTTEEYYVKPSKRTRENMTSDSPTDRTNRSNNPGTIDNSRTRTKEWNNSGTTRPTYSPSRSSGTSSPSRSSSSSSSRRRN